MLPASFATLRPSRSFSPRAHMIRVIPTGRPTILPLATGMSCVRLLQPFPSRCRSLVPAAGSLSGHGFWPFPGLVYLLLPFCGQPQIPPGHLFLLLILFKKAKAGFCCFLLKSSAWHTHPSFHEEHEAWRGRARTVSQWPASQSRLLLTPPCKL